MQGPLSPPVNATRGNSIVGFITGICGSSNMSFLPALEWVKLSLAVRLQRPNIPVQPAAAGEEGGRSPQAAAAKTIILIASGQLAASQERKH